MNNEKTTPEEDKKNQEDIFDLANKFIALANNMSHKDNKELWKVATAFRYAATRYSAHECSVISDDLAKDRNELEKWLIDQLKSMLTDNMEQQLEIVKKRNQSKQQ